MNCYDCLPLISGHIDQMNTAQEEQALQEHLTSCPECRKVLTQMAQNNTLLNASAVVPPADLTERIMKEVRKSQKKSRVNKPAIISAVVSGLTVAAVMVLVFLGKPMLTGYKNAASEELYEAAVQNEAAYEAADSYEELAENDASPVRINTETESAVTSAETAAEAPAPSDENANLYGLAEATEAAIEDTVTSPAKRGLHSDLPFDFTSPVLVIWDAESSDLDTLSGYEPIPFDETSFSDVASQFPDSLIARLSSILPISEQGDIVLTEEGKLYLSAYILPYDRMNEVFTECIGKYETNVYYPPEQNSQEKCIILVVHKTVE